jgi:hypothetical protein
MMLPRGASSFMVAPRRHALSSLPFGAAMTLRHAPSSALALLATLLIARDASAQTIGLSGAGYLLGLTALNVWPFILLGFVGVPIHAPIFVVRSARAGVALPDMMRDALACYAAGSLGALISGALVLAFYGLVYLLQPAGVELAIIELFAVVALVSLSAVSSIITPVVVHHRRLRRAAAGVERGLAPELLIAHALGLSGGLVVALGAGVAMVAFPGPASWPDGVQVALAALSAVCVILSPALPLWWLTRRDSAR